MSRVRDVSAGGVFIATTAQVRVGAKLELLFALPEGETRVQGIVRYADPAQGIGVEFVRVGAEESGRFEALLRRLNK